MGSNSGKLGDNKNGTKEIILLGMGATQHQCPYDAEVWGVNRGFTRCRRVDKLFMTDLEEDIKFDLNILKGLEVPIISLNKMTGLKTKHFPYKEIVERFGTDYFSCSICYMIAYALYKGYNYIRMYGVDMITEKEYLVEKGGVDYWVGLARGMGCKVDISRGSAVGRTKNGVPYGIRRTVNKELKKKYKTWRAVRKK